MKYTGREEGPASFRELLRALTREAKDGFVSVREAARAWDTTPRAAALRLARYERAGWLGRVRRGLYHVAPLEAGPDHVAEDPWVLAARLFAPCYIGGWTAAEHWGLTEQLFRSTFVVTAASVRGRSATRLGAEFHLVRVARSGIEGVATVWRGPLRVRVSNAERTLVDALTHPGWVGGIRHMAEMLVAYRESGTADAARLAAELKRHGNGAAHKRAGWLAEQLWPGAEPLLNASRAGRTSGVVKLDPDVKRRGRMNRRWGLWLNVSAVPTPA